MAFKHLCFLVKYQVIQMMLRGRSSETFTYHGKTLLSSEYMIVGCKYGTSGLAAIGDMIQLLICLDDGKLLHAMVYK